MITRERLEELAKKCIPVYAVTRRDVFKIETCDPQIGFIGNFVNWVVELNGISRRLNAHLNDIYETKEEADWVDKMHTERTEKFEPPFELKDNEKYKFTTANGGKMSISKFVYKSGEVQWWLSYVGTHRTFYSYQEAVEYAKKLFLGEE